MYSIEDIQKILPHRYPFLLVDRIIELEEGQKVVGIKNVTVNEPFFQGHFPGRPVMPGVLIIEAMAQVGALGILTLPEFRGQLILFAGIDRARFRRQVVPGDQLHIEVKVTRIRGSMGKCEAKAFVEENVAAEAQLMFAVGE